MLDRIIGDLKSAPKNLADRGSELRSRARSTVDRVREDGRERIWEIQVGALERAEQLLHNAPDLPVVGRVADVAEKWVHKGIEASTAVPIADYDELGAKKITKMLVDLDRVSLTRVRRHEVANKARKTVIEAIDKELERRGRPVVVDTE